MRIGFAGTPEFARVALAALADAGHVLPLVLTQPDRPAGRGLKAQASPVKQEAERRGLPLLQPRSLRLDGKYPDEAAAARAALAAARLDVLVVAAYGLILPAWTLAAARHGALNIHGSLLPRWRGAAPIQRAIEAGDAQTGITVMRMDTGLDTGPMLLERALPILAADTAATLHDRLALLGAQMIVEAVPAWAEGRLLERPQPAEGATYAHKIDKAEALIDWAEPAAVIERRVRAFDPFPGSLLMQGGEPIKLWRAEALVDAAAGEAPGTCVSAADGLVVACGQGRLKLLELQRTGGRRVSVADFLRGRPVPAGTVLGGRPLK
ncbi:methionyl-tRNA formyltransferase [Pseudorhodoferax sp.]|uniref:methionyl-tRNA formyltransferase n=1 Tax=Pseudorhodoferax sp. TaxID=1993553 RepID=UPI002DD69E00|nr:methionyl-tRNA formyltransferase [Pseudorhodoferax sp.]